MSLKPVHVRVWRRLVFVHLAPTSAPPFDLGPLGAAIDAFALEDLELVVRETDERPFNWKVLLENYSENYHTPFVHPEIDTSSSDDYPMVSDGPVLYAWDRRLHPATTRSSRSWRRACRASRAGSGWPQRRATGHTASGRT